MRNDVFIETLNDKRSYELMIIKVASSVFSKPVFTHKRGQKSKRLLSLVAFNEVKKLYFILRCFPYISLK